MRNIDRVWQKVKNRCLRCYDCGSNGALLCRSITKKIEPYFIECPDCHCCGRNAQTVRGAIRKWNKAGAELYDK